MRGRTNTSSIPRILTQTYKFELYADMLKVDNDQLGILPALMDLKTNRVIAAEALIRWDHPTGYGIADGIHTHC